MKALNELAKYLLLAFTFGCATSWVIAQLNIDSSFFGKSDFMNALITFATGAMVGTFLAIFHSGNQKIELFREEYHARTLYLLVVMCNAFIVFLSGFTTASQTVFGVGIDSLATTVSAYLGTLLVWFVARVINLFFSK
ncbi:MAG: hypothetical protein JWO61_59 [Candidatus Saccharibacteria bacterium]|nr:hypothetical protein [Candidatus Saccharibacteria bacterium]